MCFREWWRFARQDSRLCILVFIEYGFGVKDMEFRGVEKKNGTKTSLAIYRYLRVRDIVYPRRTSLPTDAEKIDSENHATEPLKTIKGFKIHSLCVQWNEFKTITVINRFSFFIDCRPFHRYLIVLKKIYYHQSLQTWNVVKDTFMCVYNI